MSMQVSQSEASIASRNRLEPLALVRSPIMMMPASARNGVEVYSEATALTGSTVRSALVRALTCSLSRVMCSGVVPQHPPTIDSPNSETKSATWGANSSAPSG